MKFYNIIKKLGYKSYNKINENLYIGDYLSALDSKFLEDNKINVVVNCSKNLDFTNINIIKYRVFLNDDMQYSTVMLMVNYLKKLSPILNRHIEKGEKILIHCRCGMQRSATILAALLMYRYKITKWQAIKIIKSKRFIAFLPAPNFNLSLDIYEKYLGN